MGSARQAQGGAPDISAKYTMMSVGSRPGLLKSFFRRLCTAAT